jgi:hypothetical protein
MGLMKILRFLSINRADVSSLPEWRPLQKAPIGYPVVKQEWIRPI